MTLSIDPIDASQTAACAVIAHRMALTLMEAPKMTFAEAMAQLPFAEARLGHYLDASQAKRRVWAARLQGEIVGHTMGQIDVDATGPFGFMGTFYVIPTLRRRGIARALLRTNAQWLTDLGMRRLVYRTAADYEPMIALLTREGFVPRPTPLAGFAEFERVG
jgi:GNAT superfamily N-acetyltransferase